MINSMFIALMNIFMKEFETEAKSKINTDGVNQTSKDEDSDPMLKAIYKNLS